MKFCTIVLRKHVIDTFNGISYNQNHLHTVKMLSNRFSQHTVQYFIIIYWSENPDQLLLNWDQHSNMRVQITIMMAQCLLQLIETDVCNIRLSFHSLGCFLFTFLDWFLGLLYCSIMYMFIQNKSVECLFQHALAYVHKCDNWGAKNAKKVVQSPKINLKWTMQNNKTRTLIFIFFHIFQSIVFALSTTYTFPINYFYTFNSSKVFFWNLKFKF